MIIDIISATENKCGYLTDTNNYRDILLYNVSLRLRSSNSAIPDKPLALFVQYIIMAHSEPLKHVFFPLVLPCKNWSFYVDVCRRKRGNPQNQGALEPRRFGMWAVADPL